MSPVDISMSEEMLLRKLGADEGLGPESPRIVTKTNKKKRERLVFSPSHSLWDSNNFSG